MKYSAYFWAPCHQGYSFLAPSSSWRNSWGDVHSWGFHPGRYRRTCLCTGEPLKQRWSPQRRMPKRASFLWNKNKKPYFYYKKLEKTETWKLKWKIKNLNSKFFGYIFFPLLFSLPKICDLMEKMFSLKMRSSVNFWKSRCKNEFLFFVWSTKMDVLIRRLGKRETLILGLGSPRS